jgi:hypothetical protein
MGPKMGLAKDVLLVIQNSDTERQSARARSAQFIELCRDVLRYGPSPNSALAYRYLLIVYASNFLMSDRPKILDKPAKPDVELKIPSGAQPVTFSDEIFRALVKDISSGTTEPGACLNEPSICRKFGVSRTPIREALRRLSGTDLVEVTPRR